MLVDEEGLDAVFARHHRLASGVRAAVEAWGLSALCEDPACSSETLTAVVVPKDRDSGKVVDHTRDRYGLSLGVGLGHLKDQTFRIGHVGSLNELEVLGTLAVIEMTFEELGLEVALGAGIEACQRSFLASTAQAVQGSSSRDLASAAT
jgi:alanine-glyoxylate transaminase/serine-glyoxylate transaminase/serine-pyruvate transaminase